MTFLSNEAKATLSDPRQVRNPRISLYALTLHLHGPSEHLMLLSLWHWLVYYTRSESRGWDSIVAVFSRTLAYFTRSQSSLASIVAVGGVSPALVFYTWSQQSSKMILNTNACLKKESYFKMHQLHPTPTNQRTFIHSQYNFTTACKNFIPFTADQSYNVSA